MAKTLRAWLAPAIVKLVQAEDGVTAIEYGLLAGLIAAMLLVGAGALGSSLNDLLSKVGSAIEAAQSGA